jgi:hypothetical protein
MNGILILRRRCGKLAFIMKRRNAALAAMLAAAIPLQKEAEAVECKDQSCATETLGKIPDQPHSHKEPPNYAGDAEVVYINTSPVTTLRVGSKQYIEFLATCPEVLMKIDESGNFVPFAATGTPVRNQGSGATQPGS